MSTHRVYWTEDVPKSEDFHNLGLALKHTEDLRKSGHKFVSIASEQDDCVSLRGVAADHPVSRMLVGQQ